MSVYTPHLAPIVVLAFLGTTFLVLVSLLVSVLAALARARRVALAGIGIAAGMIAVYGTILLGLSLFSRDMQLPQGAWKYFCEIDCHIAYAVGPVQMLAPVAQELQPLPPEGKIVIIQLKTWFDGSTISPHRGNGFLTPSERKIRLLDSEGHVFAESPNGDTLLAANGLHPTPLRTPLRPGASYISYLVFEIPRQAQDLRLLVSSAEELDAALWGHEISPFHGKAYFEIRKTESASRRTPTTL